ncbi:membrane protein [Azospira sp. I13]|nr:membrane protein [Azospira sp. I13]
MLGARALLPLLLGVAPFGVIYGMVALQSGIPPLAAVLMSSVVFAGSAQFLLAQLIGVGAPLLLMVGAVAVLNLRHALYSASVAPLLGHLSWPWKWLLAYLLTDEAYAAAIPRLLDPAHRAVRHWLLLGSGLALWSGWQLSTLAGVLLGQGLPAELPLDFALPLTFIAIVVPLINSRTRLAAALVAGAAAVLAAGLPYKLGLFVAALAGLAAGVLLQPRRAGQERQP